MRKVVLLLVSILVCSCLAVDNSLAYNEYSNFVSIFNKYMDNTKGEKIRDAVDVVNSKNTIPVYGYDLGIYFPDIASNTFLEFLTKAEDKEVVKSYAGLINKTFTTFDGNIANNAGSQTAYLVKDFGLYTDKFEDFMQVENKKYIYKGVVMMTVFQYESILSKDGLPILTFNVSATKYSKDKNGAIDKVLGQLEIRADIDVVFNFIMSGSSVYTRYKTENELIDYKSACTLEGIFQPKVKEYAYFLNNFINHRFNQYHDDEFPDNEDKLTNSELKYLANFNAIKNVIQSSDIIDNSNIWADNNKKNREAAEAEAAGTASINKEVEANK